jgi:F0F1-type ATP synthase membrane subunit b/b'
LRKFGAFLTVALLVAGAAVGADGEDGEHHDSSTLWKSLNFVVLAAGLGYLVRKTAGPYFRSRTADIQKGIAEAARQRQESEARAAEMERRLANLGAEIEKLRSHARHEMEEEERRLRTETARLFARMQSNAEMEIASAGRRARRELQAHAAELALELAREKVRQRMTPEIAGGLVDAFVRDLGEAARRPR